MTKTEKNEKMTKFIIDSMQVVDTETGSAVCRISGTGGSSIDPKTISDGNGKSRYRMKEKTTSYLSGMYIDDIWTDYTVYVVRRYHYRNGSCDKTGIWRRGSFDGFPEFETTGTVSKKNYKIVDIYSGQTAVIISKQYVESDTFFVSVNPKYDTILLFFLAIIIDHEHHGLAEACAKCDLKGFVTGNMGAAGMC